MYTDAIECLEEIRRQVKQVKAIREGKTYRCQEHQRMPDGSLRYLMAMFQPTHDSTNHHAQYIYFRYDNTEEMLKSQRIFEDFCRSNSLDREQLKSILPSRDDFAVLYRFLRANGGYSFSFDTLVYKLGNKLSLGKIRVALEAMNELGLITISEGMNISKITVNQVSAKVNLETAAIIKRLTEVTR